MLTKFELGQAIRSWLTAPLL